MDIEQLYHEFEMAVVNNSDQRPQIGHVKEVKDEVGKFVFVKNVEE